MLKKVAASMEATLELSIEELAWAVLQEIKSLGGEEKHAGNVFLHLRAIYDQRYANSSAPPGSVDSKFQNALAEAYNWLVTHGLIATTYSANYAYVVVTRRGAALESAQMFQEHLVETALKREALHPTAQRDAWPLYVRGKFDLAIFEAFKQVEIAVRTKGGFKDTDVGTALMRRAFATNGGPITDMTLPEAEREAIGHLFAGSVGAFKNPNSHREVGLNDAGKAAELLMLASHLLKIVDDA